MRRTSGRLSSRYRSGMAGRRRSGSEACWASTLCLMTTALLMCAAWADDADRPEPAPPSAGAWVSQDVWDRAFPHRNDERCPGAWFYEYADFITAAEAYPTFGTTGNEDQQRQEIASLFAHMAHETRGGWITSEDGPHAWGLCIREETPCNQQYCGDYQGFECDTSHNYCGRGPMQLRWNYRYGLAGNAIGFDGIHDPEIVEYDSAIGFKTALWYWFWAQPPKPVLHDIHTGRWQSASGDYLANRTAGFGLTINIMNGLAECGRPTDDAQDRIDFYRRMCSVLEVDPGPDIDCEHQTPYT